MTDYTTAVLRECRGLVFDAGTGQVISRRYHKFFNLGEREETREDKIDWSKKFHVLEKLDGSMVTIFRTTASPELRIGTKMGETDVAANAAAFISAHPNYSAFAEYFIAKDYTPIFEWCSRKNRIVVDYPEDRLVLTALRDNRYGEYIHPKGLVVAAEKFGIECVKISHESVTLVDLLEHTKTLELAEGYVIRFEDGHMLKIKGEWYCQLHRTMEHIQHEKDLIRLILDEKLDDAKPFLPIDLVEKLDKFGNSLFLNVKQFSETFAWECIEDFDASSSKKQYAARVISKSETGFRFNVYDFLARLDSFSVDDACSFVYALFIDKIKNNLSTSTRVDSVRHFFGGIRWET